MTPASKFSLGADVVAAIAQAKNDLRMNRLRPYEGAELLDPHAGARGCKLLEAYVGAARHTDPLGAAGRRRLVLKVQSGRSPRCTSRTTTIVRALGERLSTSERALRCNGRARGTAK